jgi:hypothetical protein
MSPKISQSEAHSLIVKWMRTPVPLAGPDYGYDLYLPSHISQYLGNPQFGEIESYGHANMRAFMAAAWELCRRGILRPGVRDYGGQGNSDGYGFSITPTGEAWLEKSRENEFIALEPGQIAQRLAAYQTRFGDGFHQRAQEAVKCYLATANLGCCSMCGAAAESVLLAVAGAKSDPDIVVKMYRSVRGRSKIESLVLGAAAETLRAHAAPGLSLLHYWRDDASHGVVSPISEADAFTGLVLLIRFAALMNDHWPALTAKQ